jgi:hypothetical protein
VQNERSWLGWDRLRPPVAHTTKELDPMVWGLPTSFIKSFLLAGQRSILDACCNLLESFEARTAFRYAASDRTCLLGAQPWECFCILGVQPWECFCILGVQPRECFCILGVQPWECFCILGVQPWECFCILGVQPRECFCILGVQPAKAGHCSWIY